MVVLITGCSGIARATAEAAESHGAQVLLAGLGEDCFQVDLTSNDGAGRALAACLQKFGRIDALFNVAGVSGRRFGDGPLHECTDEGWSRTMDLNLKTTFLMSRAVLRHWLALKQPGTILNMSSVLAESPEPAHFATHAYAASKAAISGMTRSMAAYYAPHRIRINAIAPGLVATPMSARAQGDDDLMKYMERKQPVSEGIIAAPDIASAAWFLLSDASRAITGQIVTVDGGWSVSSV
jgi:NAD(P)-dependent dehydrogenase (short-subunit alcohol dehydrogenase family)